MTKTTFATNNPVVKKAWEEKLVRDALKDIFFAKFTGTTSDSIVTQKNQLEKDKGDQITVALRKRLTGAGVEEGTQMEGNEEPLATHAMQITLKQYRNAVRDDGIMSRKRAMFEISTEATQALKGWMSEKIDSLHFDELGLSATGTAASKIFYKLTAGVSATGTAATAKAALKDAESKLTLNFISYLKTWALTGGNRTTTPLQPVMVNGKPHYVFITHPDCLYDLRSSTEFQQAMREADTRGKENNLFSGATAIWDNVAIFGHENCAAATDGGGASVPWAKGSLLGSQALCVAYGKRPEIVQKSFDYENEEGYSIGVVCGVKRSVYDGKDFGSVGVYLSRTNVSGL